MKKNIFTVILIFLHWVGQPLLFGGFVFAQSVTIAPSTSNQTLELKKSGIGLNHREPNNAVGFGTFINNNEAYFQTHTNHSLYFNTNNGNGQMKLSANGSFAIGTLFTPTQKLFVQGNTYFSGNLDSDGRVSVGSLVIGGGSTINKFFRINLMDETTSILNAETCSIRNYDISGVSSTDIVTMNIEGSLPGNIVVANVRPLTNEVEVKFCNNGTSSASVGTTVITFNIFK